MSNQISMMAERVKKEEKSNSYYRNGEFIIPTAELVADAEATARQYASAYNGEMSGITSCENGLTLAVVIIPDGDETKPKVFYSIENQ